MFSRQTLIAGFLSLTLTFGISNSTSAITIDEFDGTSSVNANSGTPNQSTVVTSAKSIGGKRSMKVQWTGGAQGITLNSQFGFLNHSQDGGVTGQSVVTWDGDDTADNTITPSNPSGLGNLNLLEDGADAFKLVVNSFDYPASMPVTINIFVYDASGLFAEKSSFASITLSQVISADTDISVPFANFAISPGALTTASFSNVGAIVLQINGNNPAIDFTLSHFSTNGECPAFPANGTVYSICNKCISDPNPNSCIDCAGVPNGTAVPGGPCDTGDVGVCADGTYESQLTYIVNQQNCSCKAKTTPTPEICDGLDNDCDGQSEEGLIDVCGICGGDGKSCLDCAGTPFGTKVPDQCGVCGGDGKSCLDCAGTPNGGKVVDQCGICGGDNSSCTDCAGTPNGGKTIDQCGVCGGDGKSCLDCKGSVFGTASVDKCGVCGGDNTSCLDCREVDLSEDQFELDHGAKLHEKLIVRNLKNLGKLDKSKATKAYIKKTQATAHELQERNWVLSWTMKSVITICGNTTLCTQDSSNEAILSEYTKHSTELRDLGKEVIARLTKLKVKTKKLSKSNEARHVANIGLASTIPTQFTIGCNL